MVTMGIDRINFIELIKSVVLNQDAKIEKLNVEDIIKYAKFHSLEYIIYLGLKKLNITNDSDYFKKFKNAATINAYKSVIQDVELENISKHILNTI